MLLVLGMGYTLLETNSFAPKKMDGWNTTYFPIGFQPIFRGNLLVLGMGVTPETSLTTIWLPEKNSVLKAFCNRSLEALVQRWRAECVEELQASCDLTKRSFLAPKR